MKAYGHIALADRSNSVLDIKDTRHGPAEGVAAPGLVRPTQPSAGEAQPVP